MTVYNDNHMTDSIKIIQMAELTFTYGLYFRIINEEIIQHYLHLTLPLVQKNNSDNLKVYLYKPLFLVSSDIESEETFENQYIKYVENTTDPLARFEGWMMLGKANIDENYSLNYLFNALDAVKNDKYRKQQAEAYQQISYHYSQKNNANQLKYALRSVELAKESGDMQQMIASWKELGTAYFEDPEGKYIEEALDAYNHARTLFEDKLNIQQYDIRSPESLHYMEVLVTIGSIYQSKNQMNDAVKTIEGAQRIATANNMTETQAFCHKELGILYQKLGEYQKAERNYLTAERLMAGYNRQTIESSHIDYEIKLQLADLYRLTGHYQASTSYYEAGIDKYRQMFDKEMIDENQRIRAFYEAQKQERDIAGLKTIVELKEKQKYYYWALAAILTLILFSIYRLYSYKITTVRQLERQFRDEADLLELDHFNAELQARLKQEETAQL